MSAGNFILKAQKYFAFGLTTRLALPASGLPPTENGESWRPSYCVSAVCQNKAKWRSKQKSKTILFTIQAESVAVFPWDKWTVMQFTGIRLWDMVCTYSWRFER